jgi:hypothetical protein
MVISLNLCLLNCRHDAYVARKINLLQWPISFSLMKMKAWADSVTYLFGKFVNQSEVIWDKH